MSSGLLEMYDDDVWCGWPVVTSPSPAVAVRSMSSGGQHWHSTLHTPHHTTPQLLHLHHTDSLTRTCILSQHCNRDTFRDLDFVVPPALSYQHTPSFLGFSCGAAETVAIRHVAVALLNMNRSQSMIVTFSDALPEWFILWAAVELATMSAFDENPFAVSTVINCATLVHWWRSSWNQS